MNTREQNLYLNTTKSVVYCFEQFVDTIGKHGDVLSDAELINKMKQISKKLQTVINKWDTKLVKLSVPLPEGVDFDEKSSNVPLDDDFENLCAKKRIVQRDITSSEDEPNPGCSYEPESKVSKEESVMLQFNGVDEKLILGPDGFYVEELTPGFWKCDACNAVNLPLNNLLSHINGKNHKKKIHFTNGN